MRSQRRHLTHGGEVEVVEVVEAVEGEGEAVEAEAGRLVARGGGDG